MRDVLLPLIRNAISLLGTIITTVSAMLIISLFGIELAGFEGGPYLGILAFVILPSIFVFGLLLIPLGVFLERRKMAKAIAEGKPIPTFPVFDLNNPRTRKFGVVFLALTTVNVVILAVGTYKGVEVMDSTKFCGTTCHSVMSPEYTTYQRSPHARVRCVECHIGPGASWFVKSKLSGSWQMVAVALNLYPRPIAAPVENLRPARETCEQCHWPTKFVGERLKVISHFTDDEQTKENKTVLLLNVGGTQAKAGASGIHWHVGPGVEIRYLADKKRENIADVELKMPDGSTKTFKAPAPKVAGEGAAAAAPSGEKVWRRMDCIDCHNRPTHIYGTADGQLDGALAQGMIDPSLPFIRREGLRLLKETYASHDEAKVKIPEGLKAFYAKDFVQVAQQKAAAIDTAGAELVRIYTTNVFPQMNIKWGTYPNFLGHDSAPGCFRCHDGDHKTDKGEEISQECNLCHQVLASEEQSPEILKQLHP